MDSPKKLTVNIMAPGKPSCWALWWWIWAFSALFSAARLRGCTIKSLPLSCGALSMYGGAKLTLVAMTPVVIFYAIAFTDLALYDPRHLRPHRFYENAGVAGVFVYGFFEKFLIPTGLHHFVWSPSSSPRLAAR